MKKLFFIPLFFLGACAGEDSSSGSIDENGDESTDGSPTINYTTLITKENAFDVSDYDNTPESVVQFFYASRIRGDKEWEKVCLPEDERSDRMKRKLEDYNEWTILQYKFVNKKEKNEERFFVTLWMEISVDGETDEGEDQAEVELIGGKWIITSIPS